MQRYFVQFTYWGTQFRWALASSDLDTDLWLVQGTSEAATSAPESSQTARGRDLCRIQAGRGDGAGGPGVRPLAHPQARPPRQAHHQLQGGELFSENRFCTPVQYRGMMLSWILNRILPKKHFFIVNTLIYTISQFSNYFIRISTKYSSPAAGRTWGCTRSTTPATSTSCPGPSNAGLLLVNTVNTLIWLVRSGMYPSPRTVTRAANSYLTKRQEHFPSLKNINHIITWPNLNREIFCVAGILTFEWRGQWACQPVFTADTMFQQGPIFTSWQYFPGWIKWKTPVRDSIRICHLALKRILGGDLKERMTVLDIWWPCQIPAESIIIIWKRDKVLISICSKNVY